MFLVVTLVSTAAAEDSTPTVHVNCVADRCDFLEALPEIGVVNLIIVGANTRPRVVANAHAVRVERCSHDKSAWCVRGASVVQLQVTAKTSDENAPDATRLPIENVGAPALRTPQLDFTVSAGEVRANLVGPDVSDAPPVAVVLQSDRVALGTANRLRPADSEFNDDTFADVVLVGGEHGYKCTGILITDHHVLTAAHCLPATRVGFGNSVADAKEIRVTKSVAHAVSDVAVLETGKRASLPLHKRRRRISPAPIGPARILGFGVKDQVRLTGFGEKRALDVPVDGWGCTQRRSGELGCNPERELVLRGGRGNDTCLGDSGGPIFEQTPAGWRLIGITSRGTRPKRMLCGEGGVYSRVDVIANWIEEVIKK